MISAIEESRILWEPIDLIPVWHGIFRDGLWGGEEGLFHMNLYEIGEEVPQQHESL